MLNLIFNNQYNNYVKEFYIDAFQIL